MEFKYGAEMRVIRDLFLIFAKIGLFTFGGGYAMISLIEDECVRQKRWITHDDMMNITVIAESTPGPIAINCATFVGYRQAGFAGALAATLGIVLPSFAIIFLISMFLDSFLEIAIIARAFQGIKIGVGILILNAALTMIEKMNKKPMPVGIMVCSCAAMMAVNLLSLRFSSISLMLFAGFFSLAIFGIKNRSRLDGGGQR